MLIGDPKKLPHPVEAMGLLISSSQKSLESIAKDNTLGLRIGGFFITFTLILISGLTGWFIERLFLSEESLLKYIGLLTLVISLASAIAYKSLHQSVMSVLQFISEESSPLDLDLAKDKLRNIVGRDVNQLDKKGILRATAESASENSVDGVFAPIFWMLVGIFFWHFSTTLPGPLTLSWIFKASSTLDSMVGYKEGKLIWIGYASAKLDDLLTWIPCRIVLITLPLISRSWYLTPKIINSAWREGSKNDSPNSGLSEAIFAHCFQIRMGGISTYNKKIVEKKILAPRAPEANKNSIKKMINFILYLELSWIVFIVAAEQIASIQLSQ